ncbi:outer membrane protein assembly factor BamA, partial [Rhodovulum sulfidophilum]|nr:outer membrane protein assembly factor BamA [Rhodovulum sulfidophilum]
ILRRVIRSDTFVADRIEFDKQVLRDFYMSRGYVDFQVLSVTPELTRNRDAYLLTYNIREGQKFHFGSVTTSSDLSEIDPDEFMAAAKVSEGDTYTPLAIENTVARMERLAVRKGLNFIRITPRITRNDRDLTLDVEFVVEKGPRVFVERIDIEGNATTLDRVE